MRNFRKLKELLDYSELDVPEPIHFPSPPHPDISELYILRMLVRPKYGPWMVPPTLEFLKRTIHRLSWYDKHQTGIHDSWCYITIRHGQIKSSTDNEWHFDGSSFRTDIIPERNYIWTDTHPTEYKTGNLVIPHDFDPLTHNLFTFAEHQLRDEPIQTCKTKTWYLLSPFVLHRRPSITGNPSRTFIRVCFTDIEGRDINNTPNELLPTPFFGRDPVKTFRNKLINYYDRV